MRQNIVYYLNILFNSIYTVSICLPILIFLCTETCMHVRKNFQSAYTQSNIPLTAKEYLVGWSLRCEMPDARRPSPPFYILHWRRRQHRRTLAATRDEYDNQKSSTVMQSLHHEYLTISFFSLLSVWYDVMCNALFHYILVYIYCKHIYFIMYINHRLLLIFFN